MKTKVLIIVPRWDLNKYSELPTFSYMFPLGIPYICAVLKSNCIQYDVLNLNHSTGKDNDVIREKIQLGSYSIVATGANSKYLNELNCILSAVKRCSNDIVTILGGIIVTTEPELVMNVIHPDYGICGDGEITLPRLIQNIMNGTVENIHGVLRWNSDNTLNIDTLSLKEQFLDLDSLPFPDFESCGFKEWLDNIPANNPFFFHTGTLDLPRTYPIMGSRGCPYSCTFCFHTNKYQERSLANLFDELEIAIPKFNINLVFLYDDCFLNKLDRAFDFCDRFQNLREKIGGDIHFAIQGIVSAVNEKILLRLKEAGCISMSYGFESYDEVVLKSMNKPITPAQIDNAYKLTRTCGMNVQASFIFGDSAETESTYKKTLEYWKNNCADQVGLAVIVPYPNSAIYQKCLAKGIIADKLIYLKDELPAGIQKNFTNSMNEMQYQKMTSDVRHFYRRYVKYAPSEVYSNSKIKEGRYCVKVKCPWCNHFSTIDNILSSEGWIGILFGVITTVTCKHCLSHIRLSGRNHYLYLFCLAIFELIPYIQRLYLRKPNIF